MLVGHQISRKAKTSFFFKKWKNELARPCDFVRHLTDSVVSLPFSTLDLLIFAQAQELHKPTVVRIAATQLYSPERSYLISIRLRIPIANDDSTSTLCLALFKGIPPCIAPVVSSYVSGYHRLSICTKASFMNSPLPRTDVCRHQPSEA